MKKCSILRGDVDNFKNLKILVNGNCIVVREMKILKIEGGGMDFGWGKVGVKGEKLESRVGRKHTAVSAAKAAFSRVNIPLMLSLVKK